MIWSLLLMTLSMLAVAWLAWKLVQRQERGDDQLESLLKKDDDRAERGLRRAAGLPDKPTDGSEDNTRR
ncbi:MAG: hypothetical protein FJ270_00685 [Planctomycetes bacterium]|nr:hypothetical protein [Planctomycetota bacterium]